MTVYTMCGGCGATTPEERCIGCLHDFGGDSPRIDPYAEAAPKLVTPAVEPNLRGSDFVLECLKDARSKLNDQSEIDLAYIDDVIAKATTAMPENTGKRDLITPQMIRDTAAWEQIEDELRDELRCAADALEATETEAARLRRMVEIRDEFIIGKGLWGEFKEVSREAE